MKTEVLAQQSQRHGPRWRPVQIECPCGRVRVVVCDICSVALVMTVRFPPCRHAVALLKARS